MTLIQFVNQTLGIPANLEFLTYVTASMLLIMCCFFILAFFVQIMSTVIFRGRR